MQESHVTKSTGSRIQNLVLPLFVMQLWASSLSFLCFIIPIPKVGIRQTPTSYGCEDDL